MSRAAHTSAAAWRRPDSRDGWQPTTDLTGTFTLDAVALTSSSDTVVVSQTVEILVADRRSLNPNGILPIDIGAPISRRRPRHPAPPQSPLTEGVVENNAEGSARALDEQCRCVGGSDVAEFGGHRR